MFHKMKSLRPLKKTRTSVDLFVWDECCFFCGHKCNETHHADGRKHVCRVETIPLRQNILQICDLNPNVAYYMAISHRMQSCIDLVAVRAKYHKA